MINFEIDYLANIKWSNFEEVYKIKEEIEYDNHEFDEIIILLQNYKTLKDSDRFIDNKILLSTLLMLADVEKYKDIIDVKIKSCVNIEDNGEKIHTFIKGTINILYLDAVKGWTKIKICEFQC